jgi:hypothetical protein
MMRFPFERKTIVLNVTPNLCLVLTNLRTRIRFSSSEFAATVIHSRPFVELLKKGASQLRQCTDG